MCTRPATLCLLPWAAIATWLLWVISLGDMAWYYAQRSEHPSYVPLLTVLALLALAGIVLLLACIARVVFGPNRRRAGGWLLLGLTPILMAATHLGLSAWFQFRDHSLPNAPSKWASSAFANVGELVARARHGRCSTGQRVALLHDEDDQAYRDLPSLDAHVERMEGVLGARSKSTTYLCRGPVFTPSGIGGWYLCGLAVAETHDDAIGTIDRHELAHAVIDIHCDIHAVPPAVLVEGWAESQSGYDDGYMARRAWRRYLRGERMSLQAMTGEEFYFAADWQCYELGGPLVDYLLRTYGGAKFLELYTTCRPKSFAADVERVYGLTLNELDRCYWADIAEQLSREPLSLGGALASAALSHEVNRRKWEAFAHDFAVAFEQPAAETGPLIIEFTRQLRERDGEPQTETNEFIRSGDRHRWLMRTSSSEQLVLATPELSCLAHRPSASADWSLENWDSLRRRPADYWNCLRLVEIATWPASGDFNDLRLRMFVDNVRSESFRVTRLSDEMVDGEPGVRLECEFRFAIGDESGNGASGKVHNRLLLLPMRRFAIREYEITGRTTVESGRFDYPADEPDSGRPVRMVHHLKGHRSQFTAVFELVRYEPWNGEPSAFSPQQLGISQARVGAFYRRPWYLWCWGPLAMVSFIGGIALLRDKRRRPSGETFERVESELDR